MTLSEEQSNQEFLAELDDICKKYGYQLITIGLKNLNKEEFMEINRLTIDELLKMSENEVKH